MAPAPKERECATPEQLKALEERLGDRIDGMLETIRILLAPMTHSNKLTEVCIRLLAETAQKALQPTTLGLLIILAGLIIGGTPAALALAQGYLIPPI
jgi:hypothetical protein